jgi:uncharacterized protein
LKKLGLLCIVIVLSSANIVFAASFDCAKASSKVEKVICDDSEISTLDDNLAEVYKKALAITNDKESLKSEQKKWLKERNGCSSSDCLKEFYASRIQKLNISTQVSSSGTNVEKSLENTRTYAGVKFGDKIENYKGSIYGSYFIDMRGRGIGYSYADFSGDIISSKNNDKIDTIRISKSFKTTEELNKLKESFIAKYKFIEEMEKVEYHYLYKDNYKKTTYLYDDDGVQIKLIENDYTKFEDPCIFVTIEYLSKKRVSEIKLEKEQEKIETEKKSNKIKKETSGL